MGVIVRGGVTAAAWMAAPAADGSSGPRDDRAGTAGRGWGEDEDQGGPDLHFQGEVAKQSVTCICPHCIV